MGQNKIAVVGAGAAGMVAAITAASYDSEVTLYEKKARVGQKLLVTGNGKCNLSNKKMDAGEFYTAFPERVEKILHKFSVNDTIDFFDKLGVMIRDKGGYLYPYSEQAQVVLDALRLTLSELKIKVECEYEVEAVVRKNGGFCVHGNENLFDKVIITCGSLAGQKKGAGKSGYQLVKSLGHQVNEVVPGLCKLKCREDFLKALAGVRCQAKLTLFVNGIEKQAESGELQFVADAISGIPIFQLSRTAAYALLKDSAVTVKADFFPEMTDAGYEDFCLNRLDSFQDKTIIDFLLGMTNKKINQVMISLYGLKQSDKVNDIGKEKMVRLLNEYRKLSFTVVQTDSFENAQVCAGGVSLAELSDNLESLTLPGLFFAGEIVDVDGRCGGYNLQWAWSSGYAAGNEASK
ncbi:MAG: aminoacetone oxidase family FAD-binding enzyme [Lachnospiraceae bacterium]|nr:aminoacetone oxidase family FAD-binding enzyme [Lachnospiraceae bacterium]